MLRESLFQVFCAVVAPTRVLAVAVCDAKSKRVNQLLQGGLCEGEQDVA